MRIILAVALVLVALAPIGYASPAQSAQVAVCVPPYAIIATASIGAGEINFCVYYPSVVLPGSTFQIISVLTAPPSTTPAFTSAANAFLLNVGCTEGTPQTVVPTTNGVVGTIWTAISTLTMTSEQCDLVASISLNVGAVPSQIYATDLPLNIRTENVRQDNFNYLCDSPAIAPNAYSVTTTTCNRPNLNNHFPGDSTNLGFDTWTTVLFWIAAVLFFSYMGWLFALAFALPGLLSAIIPSLGTTLASLDLDFQGLFVLCLVGFCLEIAANRFTWGGYQSGTRRLRFGARN